MSSGRAFLCCASTLAGVLLASNVATAIEMGAVYNGSLDQPRINMLVRVAGQADPLDGTLLDLSTLDPISTWNIEGFLDTGASAILIASSIAAPSEFNIPLETGWIFEDVGVASTPTQFNISQLLDIRLAPSNLVTVFDDPPNPGVANDAANNAYFDALYPHSYANMRAIVGPINPNVPVLNDPLEILLAQSSEVNVFGMPLFEDKVAVFDGRSINTYVLSGGAIDFNDLSTFPFLRTYLYDPGTPFNQAQNATDPGIPGAALHIQTSFANFERFVGLSGSGVQMPSFAHNPFIGANPVNILMGEVDNTPGITLQQTGRDPITGNFLFDTGAAATIVSSDIAAGLDVRYKPGFGPGNENPRLQRSIAGVWTDMSDAEQFELTIGGIDGTLKIAGFFVDSFSVPTLENDPLNYSDVPVLVFDIAITETIAPVGADETWEPSTITLDGIFGMNLLFGSVFVDEPLDIFGLLGAPQTPGAFDFVTFDEQTGVIGLSLDNRVLVPEPGTILVLIGGGLALLVPRRR